MNKVSEAGRKTRKLIEGGMAVCDACRRTGYRSQNVYSSAWFKALGREPRRGRTPSVKFMMACKLIQKGKPVSWAAKRCEISPSTIYQSAWWREWRIRACRLLSPDEAYATTFKHQTPEALGR